MGQKIKKPQKDRWMLHEKVDFSWKNFHEQLGVFEHENVNGKVGVLDLGNENWKLGNKNKNMSLS